MEQTDKVTVVDKLLNFLTSGEREVVVENPPEDTPEDVVEETTKDVVEETTEDVTKDVVEEKTEETTDVIEEALVPEETKVEDVKPAFDKYEASKKLVAIGITDPEVMDNFISILEKDDKTEIIDLIGGLITKTPGKVVNVTEEVVKENKKPKRRV